MTGSELRTKLMVVLRNSYCLFATATLSLLAAPVLADTCFTNGRVKSYTQGKEIILIAGQTEISIRLTKSTRFMDVTGKQWVGLDNPIDDIWAMSRSITVKFMRKGSQNIAEYVQFPYGVIRTRLMNPARPTLLNLPPMPTEFSLVTTLNSESAASQRTYSEQS